MRWEGTMRWEVTILKQSDWSVIMLVFKCLSKIKIISLSPMNIHDTSSHHNTSKILE